MKKLFYICIAIMLLYLIFSFCHLIYMNYQPQDSQVKERIENAKMKTYVDKRYGVRVPYPDFFVADTSKAGTARFTYYDKSQQMKVRLAMFVVPNVEGWSIKEAAEELCDSVSVCQTVGKDYYIMYGSAEGFQYIEKCFLIDNNWIDYTVYFHDEREVQRLIDTVLTWTP